jgi:hypothetical protein
MRTNNSLKCEGAGRRVPFAPGLARRDRGYALILTLAFISMSLLVLASLSTWNHSNTALTARNNAYHNAVAAAESATEVALSYMDRDFTRQALSSDPRTYEGLVPGTLASGGWPAQFEFSDGHGNVNRTDVVCDGWQQQNLLDGEFAGLYGMVNSYRITSNARILSGPYPAAAGVSQSVWFISIPVFQYAISYGLDLEINPGAPMVITGKTHSNADLYLAPPSSLEFLDTVTYVGQVHYSRNTNDPTGTLGTTPIFKTDPERVNALTLPLGVDNNPSNVVQMLDPPPAGESALSSVGRQRLYNQSDLIVTVTGQKVAVAFNDYADGTSFSLVPTNQLSGGTNSGYSFVNTNVSFYDYREGKQVIGTELDVQALNAWMANEGFSFDLKAQSQSSGSYHHIDSIYVNDQRVVPGKLTAVRVGDGQTLPPSGLTVVTPSPLYVMGNLNAPDLTPGSTNTSQTKPASLVSDAITILSPNWNDGWTAATPLSSRVAADTTVNAAFLSGIVPSAQQHYSGGVENFPRFLENWSGRTMTYNGSMVVMFASRQATNFWSSPGAYYNPPTRKWAFDMNFLNPEKLPPNTPTVRVFRRKGWNALAASNQ